MRWIWKFGFLILLLTWLASCKHGSGRIGGKQALSDACSYLWDQQNRDGSWRSQTHSLLKGGHALTPFILWSLLQLPDTIQDKKAQKVSAAINFIRQAIDIQGVLGFGDPDIIEYPNYANAYALMVLSRFGDPSDSSRIHKLQAYLMEQQFTEHRGIAPADWVYGGWGFGEENIPWGQSGQVDLSHTRRVIQALQASGYPMDSLHASVSVFLNLLQKDPQDGRLQPAVNGKSKSWSFDGGFYYSPVVWAANKAQQDSKGFFRSYPTATCDGYLALTALGGSKKSKDHALDYLQNHPQWFGWGGIDDANALLWSTAMQCYHLMVRSEVYLEARLGGSWIREITNWALQNQLENGSFVNPEGAISKEDDPLVATTMMLNALWNGLQADIYVNQ